MAYLTGYTPEECRIELCRKIATQELRRWDNESLGFYCVRHGAIALENQWKVEERE